MENRVNPPIRKRQPIKAINRRPKSPQDETPLSVEGQQINRENIPIVDLPEETIKPASPEKTTSSRGPPSERKATSKSRTIPSPRKKKKKVVKRQPKKSPPKKLKRPNFEKMTLEQRDKVLINYQTKIANFRKAFPDLVIRSLPDDLLPTPENLLRIHQEYEKWLDHILISEKVSWHMIFLFASIGSIEYFLTKLANLPASGFFIKQISLISKYQSILYEIGEENLSKGGGRSSPLARLFYLILATLVTTIGARLFESFVGKTTSNFAENAIYKFLANGGSGINAEDSGNMGGFDMNSVFKFLSNMTSNSGNQPVSATESKGPVWDE